MKIIVNLLKLSFNCHAFHVIGLLNKIYLMSASLGRDVAPHSTFFQHENDGQVR